jgi:hypothetical protein
VAYARATRKQVTLKRGIAMRIKETKDNWKASNILRKLATPPEQVKHQSHKNTKKWCKGKVGVEHDYKQGEVKTFEGQTYPSGEHKVFCRWRVDVCRTCGKQNYITIR